MPQPLSETDVMNRALARIGAGTISSPDEDSALARQVTAVFDDCLEAALAAYAWNWARRSFALQRLADPPVTGYAYAYAVPADAVGEPLRLWSDAARKSPLRNHLFEARQVHCDDDAVFGSFVVRMEPEFWPALFRAAVIDWIAARLAIPVGHDDKLAALLEQGAVGSPSDYMRGGLMGRAIGRDAASSAAQPLLASDPLTGARVDGAPSLGGWDYPFESHR